MKSALAVISLLCVVAVSQSSLSRKCYICNSERQNNCSKLTHNSNYSTPCPERSQCSLKLYSKGNQYITSRTCEPKGVSHRVRLCKNNKCNYENGENTTLREGEALQCYNCTSINTYKKTSPNSECEKINSTKFLTNCNPGEVCGLYEARRPNGSVYILERKCDSKDWKLEFQMICYNDNCNNLEFPSVKNENWLKNLKYRL